MKAISIIFVVLITALQIIPVNRSNPKIRGDLLAAPEVKQIFKRSCYDCHSNETNWRWYSWIAPVSFMVANHVHDGRKHLNFSDWITYPDSKKTKFAREILEEIKSGEMPLSSYALVHRTGLSSGDIAVVEDWLNEVTGEAADTTSNIQEGEPKKEDYDDGEINLGQPDNEDGEKEDDDKNE